MDASGRDLVTATSWTPRMNVWLAGLPGLLVKTELLWVVLALASTCTTLLWGLGLSWIGLAVAASAFPLRRWKLGYFSRRTPFEIPCGLLLLASLLGLAVSPDRILSLRAFQSVLACILLYYSLVNVGHPALIKWGVAMAVVGVFAGGVLDFRESLNPPSMISGFGTWVEGVLRHLPHVPRVPIIANPIMSTAHGLAIALEMVLLPLMGLALFTPRMPGKAAAILACVPFFTLLLLLGSQGAWLAIFAGVAVLVAWRSRWAAPVIVAAVGLGYLGYRLGSIDPQSIVSDFGPWHSVSDRVELWKGAVDVIRHHPVFGCGLGCLGRYATTSCLSPHNAYLQFYADMGIVGGLALLAALIVGGRMASDLVDAPRTDAWYGFNVGIMAAAVALAVHGIFEGSPAGIIAETADGYYYIVSPVVAILAGLFVRTMGLIRESGDCQQG